MRRKGQKMPISILGRGAVGPMDQILRSGRDVIRREIRPPIRKVISPVL